MSRRKLAAVQPPAPEAPPGVQIPRATLRNMAERLELDPWIAEAHGALLELGKHYREATNALGAWSDTAGGRFPPDARNLQLVTFHEFQETIAEALEVIRVTVRDTRSELLEEAGQ